ncbi:ABC transporter ATP-binding protein [Cohnella suwonensis]|uniref:ABC transporter ATP-binding protein n=1 Tax=Cohnella suwonensis TaxID=696072 RepID=A0ABW0LNR1_9BACL
MKLADDHQDMPVIQRRKSVWELLKDPVFLQFLAIIKTYKWYYAGVIGAQIALTGVALLFAETSRRLFDQVPNIPDRNLLIILSAFSVTTVLQLAFTFLYNWLNSALNESVVFEMRRKILNHLQRLPLSFHESHHSSNSFNIMYSELEIAKNFIVFDVQRLIALPVSFLFVGIYLMSVHPILGAIAISIGPLQLLSNLVHKSKFKQAAEMQSRATRGVFFTIGETLHGVREIKSNQMEPIIDERMADIQTKGVAYNVLLTKLSTIRGIAKEIPGRVGYIAGVGVGAYMMASGSIGPGGLVAFITLLDKVAEPFNVLVDTINNLQRSISGARRLFDVMDMEEENVKDGIALPDGSPSIRYEGVAFRYAEESNAIRGISFEVPAGTSIALVGPSGSGKSTVVKLLHRFYEPQEGTIRLDGIPLKEYSIASLRERMALVSQDIYIFDGTVAENIAAGRPEAAYEDIERAAKLAQAYDFIAALPKGFDSAIGERGIKLSHGQKQRLSIARAILRNASILVMDEPTSALDVDTESSFQKDLGQWASSCTKIIIAHRLSTIRDADYILFIDKGEIIESGTMNQLIEKNGRFRRYWEKQGAFPAATR